MRGIRYRAARWLAPAVAIVTTTAVWAPSAAEQSAVPARLASQSLLLGGARAGQRLVAVGERGHILLSSDSGASWQQAAAPTRATLTAVAFADDQRGCAVGHGETIIRTQDGGVSWELVHAPPEREWPLLTVLFLDREHAIAAGAYGAFLETRDGGATWQSRRISDDDLHLNHATRAASGHLYLAAEAGALYRSDDGGTRWQSLPSPYEGSFYGALPLGGESLLVYGLRGRLFRSDDAGNSWERLDTGTEGLLGHGIVLADGTVALGGLGGATLVSGDRGRSFRRVPVEDRRGTSALLETPRGDLLSLGEGGIRALSLAAGTEAETGAATPGGAGGDGGRM